MQWFIPPNTGNTTVQTKRWNYSGDPVAITVGQVPIMLISSTDSIRAISYSAQATSGAIIKLWINAAPSTMPPQLRSCDGHNMLDWLFTGTLIASVDVGEAIITIDTASEQI